MHGSNTQACSVRGTLERRKLRPRFLQRSNNNVLKGGKLLQYAHYVFSNGNDLPFKHTRGEGYMKVIT